MQALQSSFTSLLSVSVPEDINEIVIGLPASQLLVDVGLEGVSRRDEELDCNITVCGASEELQQRVMALARYTEACCKDVDVGQLQSKLTECVSKLQIYQ